MNPPLVADFAVELIQLAVLLMGAHGKGVLNALGRATVVDSHVEL